MRRTALRVKVPDTTLSAELLRPDAAVALLILAHGAGADFQHANMVAISDAFAARQIATLRFNFPFMEHGRRRVDPQALSVACIIAAVAVAAECAPDLARFLGGHSYGGRMASHAVGSGDLGVRGLIFCSFPLHPPKKPSVERAAHLPDIDLPMLFMSGTRDALAEGKLLEDLVESLPQARLHKLDTADHSYKILKRTRRTEQDVFAEMADVAAAFVATVI